MTREELGCEVQRRIAWSAEYIKMAEPEISGLLNGGKILRVEGKEEEVCKALDIVCGTDYLYLYPRLHHAWGIACRVQKYNYRNFTVRAKLESGAVTELDKRRYAIEKHGIYPFLTLQMFVDDEQKKIRRIGIAKTADLIAAVDKGIYKQGKVSLDKTGGKNTFFMVEWDDMINAGYKVLIHEGAVS